MTSKRMLTGTEELMLLTWTMTTMVFLMFRRLRRTLMAMAFLTVKTKTMTMMVYQINKKFLIQMGMVSLMTWIWMMMTMAFLILRTLMMTVMVSLTKMTFTVKYVSGVLVLVMVVPGFLSLSCFFLWSC